MTRCKWHGITADLHARKIPGINTTPQILVLGRDCAQNHEETAERVDQEMSIHHVVGLEHIEYWLNSGSPLLQDVLELLSGTDDTMGDHVFRYLQTARTW